MALRRVRVHVSVADDRADLERLRAVVQGRGWYLSEDVSTCHRTGRVLAVVDVFLAGSEFLVRRAAVREVGYLATLHAIDITVRSAEFVHPPEAPRLYRVQRVPSGPGRKWLSAVSSALGLLDTGRSVALANGESVVEAENGLGEAGDGGRYRLREHRIWGEDPARSGDVDDRRRTSMAVYCSVAGMGSTALGTTGMGVPWRYSPWLGLGFALLALAGLLMVILGVAVLPITPARRFLCLGLMLGVVTAFSWFSVAMGSLSGLLVLLVLMVFFGMRCLLAGTSGGVLASWAVPLVVTVGLAGLPGMSGLFHQIYFGAFEIEDSSSIPISEFWRVWPSIVTVLGGWLVVAVFLTPLGFARYFHVPSAVLRFLAVLIIPVAVISGALTVLDTMLGARAEALRHQSMIRQGRLPDSYLGVQAHFVRVDPIAQNPPYLGCQPATDRTLVSFGSTGERIFIWDPRTGEACRVRMDDYAIERVGPRD